MRKVALFLFCVFLLFGKITGNFTENDLHRNLFKNYLLDVRPKVNKSNPLEVSVELFLNAIDKVDPKRQTITIRAFLELQWRDEFLVWNENLYSNISEITAQDYLIWRPNIALMDSYGTPTDLGYDGKAIISSDGNVTVWPYKLFTVSCSIQISYFPFDKQICEFDFAAWSSNNNVLSLRNEGDKLPLSHLKESGEWDVFDTRAHKISKQFSSEKYDHIIFTIELKRKPLFHVMNLVLPVLCISLLNVTSFILPAEDGEKVTLSISVFLTLAVFLTIVNNAMPETSDDVAIFSVYVGLQLFGSVVTVVLTVVSLLIFYRETEQEVPKLFHYFVKIVCMKKNVDRTEQLATEQKLSTTENGTMNTRAVNGVCSVTWKMVSRAFDRLCIVVAILWHVLLSVIMFTSLKQ